MVSIVEMLQALDVVAPVYSRHSLHGVEVKFYSSARLASELETGSKPVCRRRRRGVSRGLVQASACGLVCAEAIISRNL